MKCEVVRDDLMISPPIPSGHEDQWEMRTIKQNRKMVQKQFWKRGAIIEHREAFMLVELGHAIPADEECQEACGMTPEQIRAAMRAQDKVSLGIHPNDYEKFDNGEILGYDKDGTGAYIPGPNAKVAGEKPLTEPDEEDDDQ